MRFPAGHGFANMLNGIFDSHAHYDDGRFDPDRDALLSSLNAHGVSLVMNAASDLASSKAAIALAHQYPFVYATCGVHPHSAGECDSQGAYICRLKEMAGDERVHAIGEIGLDYHYDFSPRDVQRRVFQEQMQLAQELDMPIIIHSREATADTLAIVKAFPRVKGVVHCFSGSAQTAQEYLALGYFIGFTGVVTFPNAKKVLEAAAAVPPERMLIETDCPYMAPTPMRGKRNDSTYLPYIVEKLCQIKGVLPQQLVDITCQNAKKVFRILGQ